MRASNKSVEHRHSTKELLRTMATYQQEAKILRLARKAYEQAKTQHWVDVKDSMSKAIEVIDDL